MLFLLRIIFLIIAISAIQRMVKTFLRMIASSSSPAAHVPTHAKQPPQAHGGTTLLQQDPVCGTYVSVDSSLKRIVRGRVLHFCSEECRERFSASA